MLFIALRVLLIPNTTITSSDSSTNPPPRRTWRILKTSSAPAHINYPCPKPTMTSPPARNILKFDTEEAVDQAIRESSLLSEENITTGNRAITGYHMSNIQSSTTLTVRQPLFLWREHCSSDTFTDIKHYIMIILSLVG